MSVLSLAATALPVPSLLDEDAAIPDHVVMGASPRVLSRVLRPGVNLAIWLRERRSAGRTPTHHQARRALFERSGKDEIFDLISRSYSNLLRRWDH